MKTVSIVLSLLLLVVAATLAYRFRPESGSASISIREEAPKELDEPALLQRVPVDEPDPAPRTNRAAVSVKVPVQPMEERGDAMLFEIDALQNMPFDQPIVMPFD